MDERDMIATNDCDHQPNGSQPEDREPDRITEEKECINNFLDHYELFDNAFISRRRIDYTPLEKVQLYTAYLTQRRDSL